jgi:hypothetical protein
MSSGVYALIGVVLGGFVTVGSQMAVSLFAEKRAKRRAWKIAVRLVSDDLTALILALRQMIEHGVVPPVGEHFLGARAWEQYKATIAQELPDDPAGDDFWRGLASIFEGTSRSLQPTLLALPVGAPLDDKLMSALRDGYEAAWGAYEALGVPPPIQPLKPDRR